MWLKVLIISWAVNFISGNSIYGVSSEYRNDFYYDVVGDHYSPYAKGLSDKQTIIITRLEGLRASIEKISREKRGVYNGESVSSFINIVNSNLNLEVEKSSDTMCSYCKLAVGLVQFLIGDGRTNDELVEFAIGLCIEMSIMNPEVCDGLIKLSGYALFTVARESTLSAGEMCNFLLGAKCEVPDVNNLWEIKLPETTKPDPCDLQPPLENAPKLKVLLISDIHFDQFYVENTWAECNLPMCCRGQGEPSPNATLGGPFGGWKCDIPWKTLESLFEHLAKEHSDIAYIVWTGDIPPHDAWSFYRVNSISVLKETVSLFTKYFPNTPCYPALGNHEAVPPNLFPTTEVAEEFEISWLYDELAEQWSRWLPEDTAAPIRRGGFYSTLVRPGFRIISLNMNYCYNNNWWLILNNKDPLGELQWLMAELQSAEDNNEKVHIIGHVPPGDKDCIRVWQKNYYEIINFYANIITAQFFGHTHKDEFELFYDKDTGRVNNVAHIIPSVTPYTYLNLGYQIANVDGDHDKTTRRVVDLTSYILDLEEANACGEAVWKKLYSAKEAYNMTSLMPSEWDIVLEKIATDDEFLQLYHKHYWKDSPVRPPCNDSWRKKYICQIRSCDQYGEYIVNKK